MITGIAASPGIAIGQILMIKNDQLNISKLTCKDSSAQLKKLKVAIDQSVLELQAIQEKALKELGAEEAEIFSAHLLLLQDPEILSQVNQMIETKFVNASWAIESVVKDVVTMFESMDDEYMKARATDVKDVFTRVLNHLEGITNTDLSKLDSDVILICDDLTPSQTATMNKKYVLGFLTNQGGKTSHSAIMARTMEIPAIVGLSSITNKVKNSDIIALNGSTGELIINPSDQELDEFKALKNKYQSGLDDLKKFIGKKATTTDGFTTVLAGNIGSYQDLESFHQNDAESVGLYRTEFLYMDRDSMPTENEQYEVYSKVLKSLTDKECVIRTLDIGGDKNLPYLKIKNEENPFLGYRAIRLCLKQTDIFKAQLRALLRASVHGNMAIMFPMISCLEELQMALQTLDDCKSELENESIPFSKTIKVGMMIEVPSAALITDVLAKYVDFFSLGTNDLTQYTCAVDRNNPKVQELYNPFNPGLLRLIHMVAKNANEKNINVSVCGSVAHHPTLVPFFIGIGINKLSMSAMHILKTKEQIINLTKSTCEKIAREVLKLETAEQIENYLLENQ